MKTYMARQPKLTRERIEAKIESSLARMLESYCEYLESDRDYVISQALSIAFKKDAGFVSWLAARKSAAQAAEPRK